MAKISLSSDIQGISKPIGKRLEHSKEIECSFGTFTLYPITDITIAIYGKGEYVENVGEVDFIGKKFEPIDEGVNMCFDPLEIEKIIFKGITILLENGAVLILNKQNYAVQQITSVDEISETLNYRYSMMDKSFDFDPCTSERYYKQMLGYKFIDISNRAPEILEGLKVMKSFEEELEKERQCIANQIEELERWLNNFDQKVKDGKIITLPELNERDSKIAELESLKNSL